MKMISKHEGGLRELSAGEILAVAGGQDDGETIVVTATKEQVAAANLAFDRAQFEVYWMGAIGFASLGVAGYAGAGGYGGAAALGGGNFLADELWDVDATIEALADHYYAQDGADGNYDGFITDVGNPLNGSPYGYGP